MKRTVGYSEYKVLLSAFIDSVKRAWGDRMVSVVLYGSVAKGTAGPGSDVDLLLIVRDAPAGYWRRLQPLLPILRRLREQACWKELEEKGLTPFLSLLVLSIEEAKENRYLYLDMIDQARILVDQEGFFRDKLESLRQRLEELGAKKVQRDKDWYWDLKPDLKLGDLVIL